MRHRQAVSVWLHRHHSTCSPPFCQHTNPRICSCDLSVADEPWLSASQLATAYLFNPFAILSCVAGTLTSAENAAVMLALAGGCLRNGPLTGFGLALGGYLGLHPLLLLVSE